MVSDARSRQHLLQFIAQTPPPPPPAGGGPRWDWKRWGFFSSYTLADNRNNTDGAVQHARHGQSRTTTGGRRRVRRRHRVTAGFTSSALRNLSWQIDGQGSSGTPYTIQTGFDDNGDLIFNDRPAGVGRNTARASTQ